MTKEEALKLCELFNNTFEESTGSFLSYHSKKDLIYCHISGKFLFFDLALNVVRDMDTQIMESQLKLVMRQSDPCLEAVNVNHVLAIQNEIRVLPSAKLENLSQEDYYACFQVLWVYILKYKPGSYRDVLVQILDGLQDCPGACRLIGQIVNRQ